MKYLYAIFFLLLYSAGANAQPDRLIGVCDLTNVNMQGTYAPNDSFVFLYNPGNTSPANVSGYYHDSMYCDEMMHFRYYASWGYYKYRQFYYQYDNNGHRISERMTQLGNNSVLEDKELTLSIYNAAGFVTDVFQFDRNGNQWDTTRHIRNTYDAQNNLVNSEDWYRNALKGTWSGSRRDSAAYDASNHLIAEAFYFWNGTTKQFQPGYRHFYTYNTQGLVDTMTVQTHSSQWVYQQMLISHYNMQGLPDTQLLRLYNLSQWKDNMLSVFAYNSNQQQELRTDYNIPVSAWTPFHEDHTIYDAQGDTLYHDERHILGAPGQMTVLNRDSVETISTNPLVLRRVHKEFDGKALKNVRMLEQIADAHNRWVVYNTGNWDTMQHTWLPGYNKTTFYYGKGLHVSNTPANSMQLNVYPNPANSYITATLPKDLRSGTAAIYDIAGSLVQQRHVPAGTTKLVLPTAHLAAGTYILSITAGSERRTSRFTVQH